MSEFDELMKHAIKQARLGGAEGGIPIGAALVSGDELLAAGRNRRVQQASPTLHAEIDCLERAGRQPASVYRQATLFTTLSPCFLCTGAVLLYGIPRVVIGENRTFSTSEDLLRSHGVEVVVLDLDECAELMQEFIAARPQLWHEDIGNDYQG
ncbi:nucleoside deaminase [Streptomyces sp. LHD-70]|uniref:nucleoside deaminase n=1 Tax=Streptomyces sp. LHD-70 TaxID=3072140 RepID=UPI00281088F9|nr:nucleoside deaminase [Streptomyces sp. LHD-70]MDQ8707148.1 nucleoside deaminase [Streptomyces sp. LHD-70]